MNDPLPKPSPWPSRCDAVCLWAGAAMPAGLVIGNAVFESLVGMVGLFWLFRWAQVRDNPFARGRRSPLVLPWAIWFLVIAVSLMVNGAGSKGWGHDLVLFRYLLFGAALLDLSLRRPVGVFLIRGLGVAVAVGALNLLSAHVLGFDLLGRDASRYVNKLGDALRISGIVAYSAPFFATWAAVDKKLPPKSRALVMALSLAAMVQLFLVHSRTPIVAAFGGLVFALVWWGLQGRASKWGWAAAGAFVVGGAVTVYQLRLWDMISIYDRLYIWKVSWEMFLQNPVLGVGVSSFGDAFAQVSASGVVEPVVAPNGTVLAPPIQSHAHNLFLEILACTGAAGLLAFGWLFAQAARRVFDRPGSWRAGLVSWPAVMLLAGVSGYNIYYSWYQALAAFLLVVMGLAPAGEPPIRSKKSDHGNQ